MVTSFEIQKNCIFPNPKKTSAPYFLYNQEFWNIHWVNAICQNSEPTKRTVNISAIVCCEKISTRSSFDHGSLILHKLQSFKFWEIVYVCMYVCRTCYLSKVVIVSSRPMQCTYRYRIYQFGIYSPMDSL